MKPIKLQCDCEKTILAPNPSHIQTYLRLVGGDLGTGNSVGVEVGVDVRGVAGVGALDMAGDLGSGRGLSAASSSDLDLSARDVELGRAAGVVDAELLDTEEVLSSGDLGGNGGGVGG